MPEGLNLDPDKNTVTLLTGPSGSGKTTLALSLAGLLPEEHFKINRSVFYVPQDADSSLNPVVKIKRQIFEAVSPGESNPDYVVNETLKRLNISSPSSLLESYPFMLSGGEKQRCLLAMAMVRKSKLIIIDEPTTAIDPSSTQQFINLIRDVRNNFFSSFLIITHDTAVMKAFPDEIYVMKSGKISDKVTFDLFKSI